MLSHRLCTSSFFLASAKLFSKVVVLINTLICGMEMFLRLYIYPHKLLIFPDFSVFSRLVGLIVVSLWPEVEHLYIFVVHLSFPFCEISVHSFVHFSIIFFNIDF